MKKTLLAFLTISLCYIAIAQTTVNTDISSSTTWNLAGSPYTITNNIDVDPGATLTIQEDVIVQFNSAVKMTVLGTLEADGATFTSASGTPSAGAWNTIEVGSTTTPGTVTLNNSQIIYAISGLDIRNGNITASNTDFTSISTNGIRASSSSAGTAVDLTVSNADFNAVGNYGLFIENTSTGTMTASATDVTINTAQFYGAFLRGNPTLTLTNSSISNTQYPVGMDTDYSVGAPDVTYSGTTSFTNNEFNGVRVNDSRMVTGDLQLRNPGYPYLMIFGFTVPESSTLSIDPGNILKFQTNSALIIEGKLLADGDLNEAIYFTSLKDDNVGGDSNNDGSTTAPAPRDWTGIFFDPDSDPTSILDSAVVRYTGNFSSGLSTRGAVTVDNVANGPSITNSSFTSSQYGAVFLGTASPTFSNNTLGSNEQTPIAMSIEANPTFTNNAFSTSDNRFDAIGLIGANVVGDGTLTKRNFTDIDNVTYVMLGDITIPEGNTLTI